MKTIYRTTILSLFLLLGTTATLFAQEEGTNYLNREMTLEREYDPSVQDANKVNTLPSIKEPEVRTVPIDYTTFTLAASPDKEVSLLPSGSIMTGLDYNKRRGYLHLGGGMLMNLDGDFGYHILSTDKDQLNVFFSHRSTNGKVKYLQIDEKIKAKVNDNLGGINYRHIFDNAVFKIGGSFGYSAFNYYGLPMQAADLSGDIYLPSLATLESVDRETKQAAQNINVYAGVQSQEGAAVGYLLDLDYRNFSYKYGITPLADGPTEHAIGLKGDLNTEFNTTHRIGVAAKVNYFNYSLPDVVSHPSGIGSYVAQFENYVEITLSPYYRIHGGAWNLQLGLNTMFISGDDSHFMVTPNVTFDVEVANKTVLYAAATGKVQSNSMYDMSRMNRYIQPNLEVLPTRNWLNATIGIKSGVIPGFWFDIYGGYNIMHDDFLLVPSRSFNTGDFGNFATDFSGLNTNHYFIGATLKYSYQKFMDISIGGIYNDCTIKYGDSWDGADPDAEIIPYGRPRVELNANLTVRPTSNITLDFDYHLATDRMTHLFGSENVDLGNVSALNAKASYAFNDTFGVYVKLNNLLFQHYDLYYGYPAQGFNLMGGLNLNF
ncbi:TonB-dependent receptor [Parabacteroides sp. OttesenSCG-928-G07]|nr:TonB-dependent receptor [Parabacteroides sp. OttesenSCG-928-G07]